VTDPRRWGQGGRDPWRAHYGSLYPETPCTIL